MIEADCWKTRKQGERRERFNWKNKTLEQQTVSMFQKIRGNLTIEFVEDKSIVVTVDMGATKSIVGRPGVGEFLPY